MGSSVINTLLVDHDNAHLTQQRVSSSLRRWIDVAEPLRSTSGPIYLRLRAYGGWFLGAVASDDRYKASEFYEEAAPSLFKYRNTYYFMSFEFADSLVVSQTGLGDAQSLIRITHTVGRRSSPPRFSQVLGVKCPEPDCELQRTRKWMRNRRACTRPACPMEFSACFERRQQKQVDVHIAVDMLSLLQHTRGEVGLMTDDADVLPAIAYAATSTEVARRITLLRFKNQPSYLDVFLSDQGVRIAYIASPEAEL